jgi:hypothetical protein
MIQKAFTVDDVCRKLKPLFGDKIDQLYFKYSTSESLEEKNEILQILGGLYQKHLSQLLDKDILLEPPQKDALNGDYPLAYVSYAKKKLFQFALREKDWPRHVCVTGMSGSGKTTFAFNILRNFIAKDKPFLVFDWKKSFRPLVDLDAGVMAFTIGNDQVSNLFKTNINIPPKGVAPKEWINTLCDLLVESFSASFGVHKILLETLDETFEGWGVYEGGKHYPNWQHVKKMLEQKAKDSKGRESGWYESALRIASVLTFGSFGKTVNYDGKKNLSVEDLFDKKVIFELNSLSNIEKKFFAEYILTYIYKLKKASESESESGFDYAILVDEAHNVFLKNKTNFVSESVTDMVYREMREYGISLICLDQHVSKLSDTVTGNSACHIAFQQQLPEDIRSISGLMQLSDNKELFSKLHVGTAIVKLSERFTAPFLIEAPFIDLKKYPISDERLAKRMKYMIQGIDVEKNDLEFKEKIINPEPIQKIPEVQVTAPKIKEEVKPVQEIIVKEQTSLTEKQEVLYAFIKSQLSQGKTLLETEQILESELKQNLYSMVDVLQAINHAMKVEFGKSKRYQEPKDKIIKEEIIVKKIPNGLSAEAHKFLEFLRLNQTHKLNTTNLYKAIGLSTRKGNNVKNELLEKGLIQIQEIKYDQGWKKFISLN